MQEINKNNATIAEFMGLVESSIPNMYWSEKDKQGFGIGNMTNLRYHFSWDWLMPVVEEIGLRKFTDRDFMGIVTIFSTNRTAIQCYHKQQLIQTIDEMDVSGISATYNAVVKFIEWYNKNSTQ